MLNEKCKLISIVIPLYNAEPYICRSIDSCLAQEEVEVEIIVVDDGSTDGSAEKVKMTYRDNPKVLLIEGVHKGKINAINKGVLRANGNFIGIQAADDVCYSYRFKDSINMIQDQINLVFGDMSVVNKNEELLFDSYWNRYRIKIPQNREAAKSLIVKGNFASGGTMLMSRTLVENAFPIPIELSYEDWWITFHAVLIGEVFGVQKPLIKYRTHENNDNYRETNGFIEKFSRKIYLLRRNLQYYQTFQEFLRNKGADESLSNEFNKQSFILEVLLEKYFVKRMLMLLKSRQKWVNMNSVERKKVVRNAMLGKWALVYEFIGKKVRGSDYGSY